MDIINTINGTCKCCNQETNIYSALSLQCLTCKENVHLTCLKRPSTPGGLFGDVFFDYTCEECSEDGLETFERNKTPWFQTILLSMYHLQHKTPGTARKGYFHWKIHLVTFIEKNWNTLFKKNFKRKKNWIGTISGSLSHHSPHFFTSGSAELGESGWWRLTYPRLPPSMIISLYNEIISRKQKKIGVVVKKEKEVIEELLMQMNISEWYRLDEGHQDPIQIINSSNLETSIEQVQILPKENERLIEVFGESELDMDLDDITLNKTPFKVRRQSNFGNNSLIDTNLNVDTLFTRTCPDFKTVWNRVNQKHNFPKPTLKVMPLSLTEEKILLRSLRLVGNKGPDVRRLYRKLVLRDLNRKLNSCPYDPNEVDTEPRMVVDSFEYETISPYTNRILKPYIRRDFESTPPWIQLLIELHTKMSFSQEDPQVLRKGAIDFCYVRPGHVPAINSLCQRHFWPGIDISDSLDYPDFSCVVLYKKIVIGFAFMVPDVNFNETYISFIFTRPEWRNCGIGSFMIYHLIQTCMGKDITLHVSVDNPAVFLYQKFGFKIERIVPNFYDMYIREDSKQSKNAFFLRLRR